MSENKKYFYIKLKENFFNTPEIRVLKNSRKGDTYIAILMELYLQTLNNAGKLVFQSNKPISTEHIARMLQRPLKTVQKAFEIFEEIGLLSILEDGTKQLNGIEDMVGQSSSEADRIRLYRTKKREKNNENVCTKSVQMYTRDRDRDRDKNIVTVRDREKEIDKEKEISSVQNVIDNFNSICYSLVRVTNLNLKQKIEVKNRLEDYGLERIKLAFERVNESDFLSGRSNKKWRANFNWIMDEKNFEKIINGYYDNYNFKSRKNNQIYNETPLSDSDFSESIPEYPFQEFEEEKDVALL